MVDNNLVLMNVRNVHKLEEAGFLHEQERFFL